MNDSFYLLGPFNVQYEMIVSEAGHAGYSPLRVLPVVEVDKRETLETNHSRNINTDVEKCNNPSNDTK